ncbi:hypothetical protein GCM10027589_54930 [Actinocorallia lasiicapitis]
MRTPSYAAVAALALGLSALPAAPAHAASVSASPTSGLDPAGATISVRGTGFNATGNNKFGIYVAFGPKRSNYATDSLAFGAARWVHPGGGGAGQANLTDAGAFSTTLAVTARYKDGHGAQVDCTKTSCYVITIAAHGVPDRSQDTFTPVTFEAAGPAAGRPKKTKTPSPTATAPASATPKAAANTPPAPAPSTTPLGGETPVAAQTITGSDASPAWPFWTLTALAIAAALALRGFARR